MSDTPDNTPNPDDTPDAPNAFNTPGGALPFQVVEFDVSKLHALAHDDTLPSYAQRQIESATVIIRALVDALEERDDAMTQMSVTCAAIIHAAGGEVYVPYELHKRIPEDDPLLIDRREPYDREGYIFTVDASRIPGGEG